MNGAQITNVGSIGMLHGNTVVADKVKPQLEINVNGKLQASYDGNAAKSINISRVSKALSVDKLKFQKKMNGVALDGQRDITITRVQNADYTTNARYAGHATSARTAGHATSARTATSAGIARAAGTANQVANRLGLTVDGASTESGGSSSMDVTSTTRKGATDPLVVEDVDTAFLKATGPVIGPSGTTNDTTIYPSAPAATLLKTGDDGSCNINPVPSVHKQDLRIYGDWLLHGR